MFQKKNMHVNDSLRMNKMEELRQEMGKPTNMNVGNNLSYGNSFEDLDLVPRKYYFCFTYLVLSDQKCKCSNSKLTKKK